MLLIMLKENNFIYYIYIKIKINKDNKSINKEFI